MPFRGGDGGVPLQLPPSALSLFRPWLPDTGTRGYYNIYNVDYSLQEPHLIL